MRFHLCTAAAMSFALFLVSFEFAKSNDATAREFLGDDSQKYEKIASLTETTRDYDADRNRINDLVSKHQGIIQLERAAGLAGRRTLDLGVGVPPDRFDAFIDAVKAIGTTVQVEIIKNNKTDEYLQLRAKRATLEKVRSDLEALQGAGGGSVDERIHVSNRLAEIEGHIQELRVSLGEFDTQNERCVVQLRLQEPDAASSNSWFRR
jgi:Domain of unknown function (DUF4349)